MPRKQTTTDTPHNNDAATLRGARLEMAKARKDLSHERKLLAKERFLAMARRGRVSPGELLTVAEIAALAGQADPRCRVTIARLKQRKVFIDDWGSGPDSMWVSTDQAIQAMREFIQCQSGNGTIGNTAVLDAG